MPRPVHSGLILPGDVARRGRGLTIHVPNGYETEQDRMADEDAAGYMICRVIVSAAERVICGRIFEPGEELAWQKHCGECAMQHIDEIRAASPRTRMPVFDPSSWDVEVDEHMRKVGERMRKERRLEVKPSERAGFS